MRFRERRKRERYMDNLERQMEHQREQIERTLEGIEGRGRRRTVLEKLWSSLPNFPGRSSVREAEREHEAATERSNSDTPRHWWGFWR